MFAWSLSDMPGIDPNIICYRLHVNSACKPVAQKRHNFAPKRVAIIEAKIDKLLATSFIEELLSFMDAYSGYNQILMHEDDKAKTSFIIERETYCYKTQQWDIELSQYDILYRSKTAIKAQALTDFVEEFTLSTEEEKLVNQKKESSKADGTSSEPSQPRDMWHLRLDGASNQKRAGAGVVITTPDGTLLEQVITLGFSASNNEAE
ncbi:hypothetical protein L3X38_041776 [Prunus dulcis]|uniref:Uncharacterized protein n=1 Tax=Prunus dulcis TaxID=3755 RepID=A0AAD4UTW0_PRUDU|nr:hypothetical protein L3X38_041776 [Prunus dulcis]